MRPRKLRRFLALALFGAILAGTGIGWGIGTAEADSATDVAYLTTLDMVGVPYSSATEVVELGHSICLGLATGLSPQRLVNIGVGAGWERTDARLVVEAAWAAYCPQLVVAW